VPASLLRFRSRLGRASASMTFNSNDRRTDARSPNGTTPDTDPRYARASTLRHPRAIVALASRCTRRPRSTKDDKERIDPGE